MAASCPIIGSKSDPEAVGNGIVNLSEDTLAQSQRVINFDDFHQQFLNNHPSTIEEDFEGENLISEMTS